MSLLVHYLYVICVICISKKLKYLKNEARDYQKLKDTSVTYSVILSVLLNKTNLILEFSSPLIDNTTLTVHEVPLPPESLVYNQGCLIKKDAKHSKVNLYLAQNLTIADLRWYI